MATLREAMTALRKQMVEAALQECKGGVTRAALQLGLSRPTLHDLINKIGCRHLSQGIEGFRAKQSAARTRVGGYAGEEQE